LKIYKSSRGNSSRSDKIFMIVFLIIFAACFLPFLLKKAPETMEISEELKPGANNEFTPEPGEFFTVKDRPGIRLHYSSEALPVLTDDMIKSESVILYDRTADKVLYSRNADMRLYPASTTKIVTACVALRYLKPETELKVGSELGLIQPESSLAYLNEDSRLTLEDALYALLLPSGNDAAYVIAVNTARTVSGDSSMSDAEAVKYFAGLMNDEILEAGADNTHFEVPDGFHNPNHYTTAADLLKISIRSARYPLIAEIVSKEYRETNIITGQGYYWENGNCLVTNDNKYFLPFATGLKTGFTDEAGYCMSATAVEGGHDLIAVILHAPTLADRYTDASRLFWAVINPQKLLEPPETTPVTTDVSSESPEDNQEEQVPETEPAA